MSGHGTMMRGRGSGGGIVVDIFAVGVRVVCPGILAVVDGHVVVGVVVDDEMRSHVYARAEGGRGGGGWGRWWGRKKGR